MIDSEIDRQHPDLAGAIADNFDALPSDEKTAHPHGTGMAGAIVSHRRLLGVAPNARILGVRAFGVNTGGAQGTSMNIVKGLQWAVDQGAKVINMSFAGPKDPILQQAMQRLTDQGIILIAAAGNAGPKSPPLFPGADPNVIAVSATDVDNKTYKNANRGKYVAIAAPGVDILVPAPEGGYQLTTGTSVAAAHISRRGRADAGAQQGAQAFRGAQHPHLDREEHRRREDRRRRRPRRSGRGAREVGAEVGTAAVARRSARTRQGRSELLRFCATFCAELLILPRAPANIALANDRGAEP